MIVKPTIFRILMRTSNVGTFFLPYTCVPQQITNLQFLIYTYKINIYLHV